MKVELAEPVVDFVRRLPPEPKRRLRQAIRDLARGRGDLERLEGPLDGYCRLRVGGYHIVFAYGERDSVQCVFAEQRSIAYELLIETLRKRLIEPGK